MRADAVLAALRTLPIRPLDVLTDAGPILIIAPHPDDESLGCGGLIASCCAAGLPPIVLVTTDGAGSHPGSRAFPPARLCAVRQQEARSAVAELGLPPGRIAFLGLQDTRSPLDGPALDQAATSVIELVQKHGIATILSTWQHDPHCDHLSAHRIAAAAAKVTTVGHLAYPVWGLTLMPDAELPGPAPIGMRLDIATHLPAKRRAIAAHLTQYAGVIDDDPAAFQLQPDFLRLFDSPFETFLAV